MKAPSFATRARRISCGLAVLAAALTACSRHSRPETGSKPAPDMERVDVGYGTTKRAFVGGAVASLDSTVIERAHIASLIDLFAGRVPGVRKVHTPNGVELRIRGTSTFLGDARPLVVVDGIATSQSGHALESLDPHDVARIDVLKDGLTAIYGVRGGNGVILITTKRAR